ncbi:hypothetical protein FRC19_000642 [Serendipita sp. 401]|nr:hypothetical protein FRC19_000642 [Serendipita sp. 401]
MLDTATSTEPIVVEMDDGATGAVDASNAQDNHENIESGSSRCSSPLQIPSSRLQSPQRPTLGVYFCPEDGERNDVLAALRVLRRQIKQTKETLRMSKMPMAQTRDIAFTLQLQDSQISQWLHLGCNIDPKKTISVKGLPIYDRMARYMSFIRDVEFDLSTPNAVEKRVRGGSFLRRFSSSDSSRSNNNKGANTVTDMRLAIASQRINASFQELKDAMEKFMREQAKEKALVEKASRVRAELGIAHTLCLPGTRARTLDAIRTWATPGDDTTPQILCLVGAGSHGKSTIASTIACEWQVNGAGGCIGTAVRLCDALEDAGSPERVLDVVLYREMVQKHGENIRVVLV